MESLVTGFENVNMDQTLSRCDIIDKLTKYAGPEGRQQFKSISYSEFTDIKRIEQYTSQTIYYARYGHRFVILSLLGAEYKSVNEFIIIKELSKKYSIPTHKCVDPLDDRQFKRYKRWLRVRNSLMLGFTKSENQYFLVAERSFYHYYSLYGFCSACDKLRCSPVWCICGRKEMSAEWTSGNKKLDEFIRKSQAETDTANDSYLEWIPFDWLFRYEFDDYDIFSLNKTSSTDKIDIQQNVLVLLPQRLYTDRNVTVTPLEISDETSDLYYQKLCEENPDILVKDTWITVGFTYYPAWQKYALVKLQHTWDVSKLGLCLACAIELDPSTDVFCTACKQPRPLCWTTGNTSLDKFIMESWEKMTHKTDSYLQWVPYSQLDNVKRSPSLEHGCSHTANWIVCTTAGQMTKGVMLKKVVDGSNAQLFDFYKLLKDYPNILSPDNIWIAGITQEPSSADYFLVFYTLHASIVTFAQAAKLTLGEDMFGWIDYDNFDEIHELGAGGYGIVFRARWRKPFKPHSDSTPTYVVLKGLKNFKQMINAFFNEIKQHVKSRGVNFLPIYGITQQQETGEYMMVIQYAEGGDLISYLNKNINRLTWRMKVDFLIHILANLKEIHRMGLIHCDLHAGNILFHQHVIEPDKNSIQPAPAFAMNEFTSFICDLGLTRKVDSTSELSSTVYGVLPYVAPEVFHTRKFTQKSDIYAIGILMYQMATGEPPFRDMPFDFILVKEICNGLRPRMPSSAPELYKALAAECCDADPNKRPTATEVHLSLYSLVDAMDKDGIGDKVYNPYNIDNLSRNEKEMKYTSKALPQVQGGFPEPSNSCDIEFDITTDEFNFYESRQLDLIIEDELASFDFE